MRRWPTDRSGDHTVEWHAGINEPLDHTGTGSDGPILTGVANQLRIQLKPTAARFFNDTTQTQLCVAFHSLQQSGRVIVVSCAHYSEARRTSIV